MYAASDVLCYIEGISHVVVGCSRGHQLHESHGAFVRDRSWLPTRLVRDDRVYQLSWNVIVVGVGVGIVNDLRRAL